MLGTNGQQRGGVGGALQGGDAYLDYHHALFKDGTSRSDNKLDDDQLIALAHTLGLDTEAFTADFTSPETAGTVAAHAQLGITLAVYSTPAFILGGQPIMGAQPSEVFVDAFETALATQG